MHDDRTTPAATNAPRHLTRRRFLAAFAASTGAAILAACGDAATAPTITAAPAAATGATAPAGTKPAGTTAASSPAASPAAMAATMNKSGGKLLKMARNAEPTSPFVGWSSEDNATLFVLINLYDSLLKTSKDGQSVEPALATKWETSADGLTWTFTLREAKFSDGTVMTAKDVKASVDACRMGAKTQWKETYKAIKDTVAVDDKTFRVVLAQPHAPLLAELAMWTAAVMPADFAVAVDKDGTDASKTRGTGAYLCEGWKKGDPIILKKNPYHWKPNNGPDEVRIEYIADDNSRLLKLQGGEVDVIDFVPLSQLASLGMQPNIQAKAFTIQQLSTLGMNVTKAPLDDKKVRQALNYALDKESILKTVYFGQAQFQNSPIPPGTFWDKTLPGYPFNLDKAKALMADSSGAKGFTLELSLPSGSSVSQQIATIAKDQWAKIGVTVNIQNLETSVLRQNRKDSKLMMSPGGWTNDMNDPTEVCNYIMRGGELPFAGYTFYNNPMLNDKITAADLEQDPKKREVLYSEVQKIYLDDAPQVFISYPPATAAWQKYVEGFSIDGLSYYRFEEVKVNK